MPFATVYSRAIVCRIAYKNLLRKKILKKCTVRVAMEMHVVGAHQISILLSRGKVKFHTHSTDTVKRRM